MLCATGVWTPWRGRSRPRTESRPLVRHKVAQINSQDSLDPVGTSIAAYGGMRILRPNVAFFVLVGACSAAHPPAALPDASGTNAQPDASGTSSQASALPTAPTAFAIRLAATGCFGTCPQYELEVDEQGHVQYMAGVCAGRPGRFELDIADADARALYDALIASGYADLEDRYTHGENCPDEWTDHPSSFWSVRADGRTKTLARYKGCKGLPEVERVDALESTFASTAGVSSWLAGGEFECERGGRGVLGAIPLAPSYRLSIDGVEVGVLRIASNEWTLVDCAGSAVATGTGLIEPSRYLVIPPVGAALDLGERSFGSIVLRKTPVGSVQALGLTATEQDELVLEEADSCSTPRP
jgi:Domain of unknown function (DUF6438)